MASISKLAATVFLFNVAFGAAKPPEYRAFANPGRTFQLIIRGNSVYWQRDGRYRLLPTRRFNATVEALEFSFDDTRVKDQDPASAATRFTAGPQTVGKPGTLYCGPEKLELTELPSYEASRLYSEAHYKATSDGPSKPVLLGMIGETQEYIYVEGIQPADPTSHASPKFQMFTGHAGKLKTAPTYVSSGPHEMTVYSTDARVTIQPGSQGSGVTITYGKKKFPLGYLSLDKANLETVLGPVLYRERLGDQAHTPCDALLDK